ncbi:hypothetical protein AVEN_243664-1 [Araneus ventricosus]|uniref:Uncharacterized protein n=1 Tax=Araneus ventricosus TaxID=182803 RepID=A0A4Y2A4T1_ARAVE|nr:hypothetical protein AVEN_243664-1 [Araneus ventricosus]
MGLLSRIFIGRLLIIASGLKWPRAEFPEVAGSRPNSTEEQQCIRAWCKRHSAGMVWKFGEGVPPQVSLSSPDYGSELQSLSQNSFYIVSERHVIKATNEPSRPLKALSYSQRVLEISPPHRCLPQDDRK